MPARDDIKSILIIGSGPIVIGQACEFDYSGTQACKVLRREGYRVILINSNPATIMTDPESADAVYIEPITPEYVEAVIAAERPDALLPTMGGQTALNTAMALADSGVLAKYNVQMIGADRAAIEKGENRQAFRNAMDAIGLESPKSVIVHTPDQIPQALKDVGLPAVIRPSFTLGGTGGGIAYNAEEFREIVLTGLDASPVNEVLIDESVVGWKEYETEVVRDKKDNSIIVCCIENIDPMGVHTGDSITVAPSMTLTDKEYQRLRDASLAVLREIGVETGGSNVQFAINPDDGRMIVIEMNPRVSRSSALASKATGFPIAKVAARLAVGYTLDEIENDIVGAAPAAFEPTLDYVVVKIPRFAFEKFPKASTLLSTAMKSVGEVMAIGRTFAEALQKACRSLDIGLNGVQPARPFLATDEDSLDELRTQLSRAQPERLLIAADALRCGMPLNEVRRITKFDPWYLEQLQGITNTEALVAQHGLPTTAAAMRQLKADGFSDDRLAQLTGLTPKQVRETRHKLGVRPVYRRIDTCAAEFEARTPYLYSSYETGLADPVCEADVSDKPKVVILGSGSNRIGQGIEFDYACCHACYALRDCGVETIMINCNPETVSTDYDTSDRLYFEPLTAEDVLEVLDREKSRGNLLGVIVQLGGQTPLKLTPALIEAGYTILGTSADALDLAEDRERFRDFIIAHNLRQPNSGIARTIDEARATAANIGYPLMLRPSHVLGGRAMEIVRDTANLERYITEAVRVSGDSPLLLDAYLSDAIEVDVDALCDGHEVFIGGVMEHIEEAGIHSGDSACVLPPHSLPAQVVTQIKEQTRKMALALRVVGFVNVQFAVRLENGVHTVYVIEVNPRASRTVPFVAKAVGLPLTKIAVRLMLGERLSAFNLSEKDAPHVAVKEAVFPFARFPGADTLLGPEMRSTGEVMGIDTDFANAFYKSQIAAGAVLPRTGRVFLSVRDADKPAAVDIARRLHDAGYTLVATYGTAKALQDAGIAVEGVSKVSEGRPDITDWLRDGRIQLVINTPGSSKKEMVDGYAIRRTALEMRIPMYTTLAGARAVAHALASPPPLRVKSIKAYHAELSA